MNCKESRLLIAGLTGETFPDGLAAHVESCPACAALLAADARLRTTVRSHSPAPSPRVLGFDPRQNASLRPPSLPRARGWGEGLRGFLSGNKLMKITLTATALAALALVSIPRAADAATPLATFAKMRTAVLAHARPMPAARSGKSADGSIIVAMVDGPEIEGASDAWALVDGNLVEIDMVVFSQGGALQAHKAPSAAKGMIDLHENRYAAVAFGADHDHLVLSPKKDKDRRTVLTLDPKSSLPTVVRLEQNIKGRWVAVGQKSVKLG